MTRFEQNLDANLPREIPKHDLQNSFTKADWESLTPSRGVSGGILQSSQLTFDDSIYGARTTPADHADPLTRTTASLQQDVNALEHNTKGTPTYEQAMRDLHADEGTLRKDVFSLKDSSADFKSFASVMDQYHTQLKGIATELWDMGLKKEASDTTAYYPLSHYEREFAERKNHGGGDNGGNDGNDGDGGNGGDGGGNGGNGGGNGGNGGDGGNGGGGDGAFPIKPATGSSAFKDLDNADNEKANTKPDQIGGNGGITSITAEQNGSNSVNFSMSGGAWGDGLWLTSVKSPVTEQNKDFTIQLNDTFRMTDSQLANNQEIEKDIVGPWGVAGTQINTKTGEVDFWNAAASKWVDVGSLGPLQANKDYNLQLGVTSHGNPDSGTYSFDYYSLNGQKVNASQNTFNDKNLGWAPGIYIQTQLDLPGKPTGPAGMTESNQTLYVK